MSKQKILNIVGKLEKASNAHADQAKTLSKDLQDETDKNVDKFSLMVECHKEEGFEE